MRITLEHAAVHERAGVAFIGIADHVLWTILHCTSDRPLLGGREARAPASAQTGAQHLVNDLFRRHLGQYFAEQGNGDPNKTYACDGKNYATGGGGLLCGGNWVTANKDADGNYTPVPYDVRSRLGLNNCEPTVVSGGYSWVKNCQ